MKKIFLGVLLLIGGGMVQANAQITKLFKYGVKVEANTSNFILSDMDGVKSKMGVGVSAGGFSKIDITRNFAIQSEILFTYQTSKQERDGFNKDRDFEYYGLESPIYAVGQWFRSNGDRFYAGLGTYTGFGFNAKLKDPEQKLYKDKTFQRWDFGSKLMLGYEFSNGFQVNAGYKIGFVNAIDKGDGKMLPEAATLGVGYRF